MSQDTITMECAVCYNSDTRPCKLVCGHSFCMSCVKEWYLRSQNEDVSCPMCRKRLYFKGMQKVCERWENERHEQRLEEIYANCFDEVLDDEFFHQMTTEYSLEMSDITMDELYTMEYHFNRIKNELDYESIEWIMGDPLYNYIMVSRRTEEIVPNNTKIISKHNSSRFPNIYTRLI